jgi:hypothetical protein
MRRGRYAIILKSMGATYDMIPFNGNLVYTYVT